MRAFAGFWVVVAGLAALWHPPLAECQLLHRYDFETAGSANDIVGSAHGTVRGSATVSGGALNTSGAAGGLRGGTPQNCVSLPASAVAGITNAFSIEVWFTANYNGPLCTLFAFSAGNTANYVLATPAVAASPWQSRVEVVGGGGSGAYQQASQIYTDTGTLHNMLVTYDGTNVTYFLDGALPAFSGLQNSFADPGLVLSNLTKIGIAGGSPYSDDTIKGKVHDFRIYGQALTLNQASAIYALGTNASNAAISNALVTPQQSTVPFNGNWVRMPFYGDVGAHDPSKFIKEGGACHVFVTSQGLVSKSSTNLRDWSDRAPVFPGSPPAWTTNAVPGFDGFFWAPDIAFFNGKHHLYYSCSSWGSIDSAIGLVTTTSLASPNWIDQGKVVQSDAAGYTQPETDTTGFNCIDPGILVDTNGTVWMVFGSYSSGILVTQLDPATGKRLNTNSLVATLVANNAAGGGWGSSIEGAFLHQRGGYYYLFANWGGCCSGTYSTYNIRVGRSVNPTGPYYDKDGVNLNSGGGTMFLESTARYIGPGHPAVMDDNGTNWFTYHFYDGLANGYPTVGMNQLYWSADGWPVLTNDWSAVYPLAVDANESSGIYNGWLNNTTGFINDTEHGKVLHLDGVTNSVSLPLSVGNASTFAAWVNWRGGADWQRIFDFGNDTTSYFYLTPSSGSSGRLRFAITTSGAGGEQGIEAPVALPTNSWHHVAVSLDGARGVLYLDGAPVATNNSLTIRPWQTLPHNNNLGKSQFASDPLFAGKLSSFRVFGRALSAAEIGDVCSANPTLAHRYSFSPNGPSAVWDSIGMAHGTLVGNAVVTNHALKLTGTGGGYANLPNSLVSGCSSVTLEFWATFGTNGNWARVFDTGNINGAFADHYFFFSPHTGFGGQRMELNTGSLRTFDVSGTLDSRTVHVAAICDPANNYMAVYTNGVLEAQVTATMPPLTGVAGVFDANAWSFIGRSLWSSDAYLNATIDELRLYAGRLTPQQIAANHLAGPGVLRAPSVTATNLAFISSGGAITLSWPADHKGWRLQVQTNALNAGLGTNWADVSGSSLTNSVNLPMDAANPSVFYRLVYP
jgi:hypothetical protein